MGIPASFIFQNRIFVEHLIRLIKIFRIASERFRLRSQIYEQIILTVCALVRLRIGS
ncbi:transposase family protein [Nostoc sp.]|uniref:transposase family protein n=1 Tax=Nostoc sp. TaxID=1180 RepID=UPI002FFA0568